MILFKNNASSRLATAIDADDTSITVTTDEGDLFSSPTGSDYELLTLDDGTNVEVVKVTARSGDTLTVVRAQEGTTAAAFAVSTVVAARVTAGILTSFLQAAAATTANLLGNTAGKAITTDAAYGAAAEVSLGGSGTIAVDLSSGENFRIDLTGSITLSKPTNAPRGRSGSIKIVQPSTGSPVTIDFATGWYFENGEAPSLTAANSAVDILYYSVIDDTNGVLGRLVSNISTT